MVTASVSPSIDAEFVAHWSGQYQPKALENKLFNEVGPLVAERGHFSRNEFLQVGSWKSQRSATYMKRNSNDDIEDITRLAMGAPERLRHRILDLLKGVGTGMASALLAVADPDAFTVIDYRAIETLQQHGELGSEWPSYGHYRQRCRQIADQLDTDLRTLDRALWQWSKEQGK